MTSKRALREENQQLWQRNLELEDLFAAINGDCERLAAELDGIKARRSQAARKGAITRRENAERRHGIQRLPRH